MWCTYTNGLAIFGQVIWTPYSDELLATLPAQCTAGREIWMAKVPLICFVYVSDHMPDRVLRQFGFRQPIPEPCSCRGSPNHLNDFRTVVKRLLQRYAEQVQMWDQRRDRLVVGEADDGLDGGGYSAWYRMHSVPYLTRIGAAADRSVLVF